MFFSAALAQTIYVKYFGYVSLDKYKTYSVDSSFINEIWYNRSDKIMILLLNQTYYAYCGINSAVIKEFSNAPSKGKFYNIYIKGRGRYSCEDLKPTPIPETKSKKATNKTKKGVKP